MKKRLATFALLFLVAASALAHAGEVHTYMGTVKAIHGDDFVMKTTAGKEINVETTSNTKFLHADNHVAKLSELVVGSRVVVRMSKDGKTAASVKMSTPKKQ